ncbi:hypothetical protein EV356DRAFT_74755 [Viridothelium virens]|uniref:Uncharacterized protein n=1 Tax=Viridothelium virens TaxID=1048519 RepID=A0A6A6GSE0_VIRVR|nr:hypothetical protein EV356DRAFT_74755 [Viridothelium virens]
MVDLTRDCLIASMGALANIKNNLTSDEADIESARETVDQAFKAISEGFAETGLQEEHRNLETAANAIMSVYDHKAPTDTDLVIARFTEFEKTGVVKTAVRKTVLGAYGCLARAIQLALDSDGCKEDDLARIAYSNDFYDRQGSEAMRGADLNCLRMALMLKMWAENHGTRDSFGLGAATVAAGQTTIELSTPTAKRSLRSTSCEKAFAKANDT